jgi:hypothetical protein
LPLARPECQREGEVKVTRRSLKKSELVLAGPYFIATRLVIEPATLLAWVGIDPAAEASRELMTGSRLAP